MPTKTRGAEILVVNRQATLSGKIIVFFKTRVNSLKTRIRSFFFEMMHIRNAKIVF